MTPWTNVVVWRSLKKEDEEEIEMRTRRQEEESEDGLNYEPAFLSNITKRFT